MRRLLWLLLLTGCAGRTVGMKHGIDTRGACKSTAYVQGELMQTDRARVAASAEINSRMEGAAQIDLSCRW